MGLRSTCQSHPPWPIRLGLVLENGEQGAPPPKLPLMSRTRMRVKAAAWSLEKRERCMEVRTH